MVKLYSTGCPKCKVLAKKLEAKGVEFEVIDDIFEVSKFAEERGINSAPILVLDDGRLFDFTEANKLINTL